VPHAYDALVSTIDVEAEGGRVLRVHAPDGPAASRLTMLWHHGSPHTGAPLLPVVEAAGRRGIGVVTYARPSYDGSTPQPGRTVGSAGDDARAILDALDIDRAVTVGYSGGGPHALAAAAAMPGRVIGVVTLACPAPYSTAYDWFDGMAAPAALRSAFEGGRVGRAAFAETDGFDPSQFVDTDWAALSGRWAAVGQDAEAADALGPDGLIDDDVAFTTPWGFDLGDLTAPVLVAQGGRDRVIPPSHARWLVDHLPAGELWLRPRDGHVAVLDALTVALDWLLDRVDR
jgi:pimeloyl-ACP methyl ester carboxylesterase